MARRRKKNGYQSPIPEDELSWRMGSTAGRKLEARLKSLGWSARDPHRPQPPDDA